MKIKMGNIGQSIQEQIQKAANTAEEVIKDVQKDKMVSFPNVPKDKEAGYLPPVPYPYIERSSISEKMQDFLNEGTREASEDREKMLGSFKDKRNEMADQLEKRILEGKKLVHETKGEKQEALQQFVAKQLKELKYEVNTFLDEMNNVSDEIERMRMSKEELKSCFSFLKEAMETVNEMTQELVKRRVRRDKKNTEAITGFLE